MAQAQTSFEHHQFVGAPIKTRNSPEKLKSLTIDDPRLHPTTNQTSIP